MAWFKPRGPRDAAELDRASARQLVWWKFRRHKLALVSLWVVGAFYLLAVFAEFFSPYDPTELNRRHSLVPPQAIHVLTEDGRLARPFVYALEQSRDPLTRRLIYTDCKSGYRLYQCSAGR